MASGPEEEEVPERRVMAAVWGPGADRNSPNAPATTLVMLDAQARIFGL